MVRELANYDYNRYSEIIKWPVREAILSYIELQKQKATRAFELEVICYYLIAPHTKKAEPPKLPDILKNG